MGAGVCKIVVLSTLLLISAVRALPPAAAAPPEPGSEHIALPLENPSFDEGGGADGKNPGVARHWQNTDGKSHPRWYAIDTQIKHSGRASQRLEYIPGLSDPWGSVWQATEPGAVNPGRRYRASVWSRVRGITGASRAWGGLRLAIRFFAPGWKMLREARAPLDSNEDADWHEISVTAEAPPGTERIQFIVYLHTEAGTIWYDDASLAELRSAPVGDSRMATTRSVENERPAQGAGPRDLLIDEHTIRWQGARWRAIDEEATYYYQVGTKQPGPMPAPRDSLKGILTRKGFTTPLRCRLVDFIDCTKETHEFKHDGKSRVLELGDDRYRVTAADAPLTWFAYFPRCDAKPGRPHLLVAQTINDRERYTTFTLNVPKGEPWAEPYTGEEKADLNAMDISQEPIWYNPDVGVCVYTGREWPCDGRSFNFHFLFYPKTQRMKLTVSSGRRALQKDAKNGGAVSRIWIFEVLDPLAKRLPDIVPTSPERRIGVYTTHPWYFLAHYGVPPRTEDQRRKSLEALVETLAFCGMNWIEFNAINGSDRTGAAWYPSKYFGQLGGDLLEELPPVAARRGFSLLPVITSLRIPDLDKGGPKGFRFTDESWQKPADGKDWVRAFGERAPDPLRPEVQEFFIELIREIAERCKDKPTIKGIGFRVNGKIGLCYVSWEDKTGRETIVRPAKEAGYSKWDLTQFRQDTGLKVPTEPAEAWEWFQAHPQAWEKWLDFRCRRTRDFWLRLRDVVRSYRRDWQLFVKCDLPAEVPATNIQWPGPDSPHATRESLELLRHHGYDPRMFNKEEGIVIQRGMMIDADRFFSSWGGPWGANYERYKTFHFQPMLGQWYRTLGGSAVEMYHNYWEEVPHPDPEFGPHLRTATASAIGRAFYEPASFSIRTGNVDTMAFMGWERPILGHEHDLRRFCQAFRALPAVEPRAFDGKVEPSSDTLWVRWFGERLAVLNDSKQACEAVIALKRPVEPAQQLRDVTTGHVLLPTPDGDRQTFKMHLEMFDLRALVLEERTR